MGSRQVSDDSSRTEDWPGRRVTVAGLGVSGVPAARVLHGLGAHVTVVNDGDDERARAQAAELTAEGSPSASATGTPCPRAPNSS